MKTKKQTKKSKLSLSERRVFNFDVFLFFKNRAENEDLVDPYVLEVPDQEPPRIPEAEPSQSRAKVYSLSSRPSHTPKKSVRKRKKMLKRLALYAGGFIGLILLVQVLYPSSRTLPFARLESHGALGFADESKILQSLADFDTRVVTVHTHTKTITTGYKDVGVVINPEQTASQMQEYSLSERLIPFSLFFPEEYEIVRSVDDSMINLFVSDVVALASKKPVDALVTFNGNKFNVTPSEEGHEYQVSSLRSAVLKSELAHNGQVIFSPTILYPDINSDQANSVASKMQLRVANEIVLTADKTTVNIEPEVLASWVDIKHEKSKKEVIIGFDKQKIRNFLGDLPARVNYPAKPNITTLLNGNQAGYRNGESGRELEFDNLINLIAETLSPATANVTAPIKILEPKNITDRKYTKDSVGVRSMIDYWTSVNSGQYNIDFRTLDGRISASLNANRLMPAVGVHKTYIATLIYNRIAGGSLGFNTVLQNGQTVNGCLSAMIVHSDESCTTAFGNIVGWSAGDSLLKSQGFDYTTLTESASLTTASDTTSWLVKLNAGNITTVGHSYLLGDLMAVQAIRSGIPAGSDGIRVENKSGAYGRVVNDIALVYHPGGNYALSVLSDGGSYSQIADLTREINKIIGQ